MSYTKIFRDPIYGYVPVYEHELQLIRTRLFQRLKRIRELHSACFPYYCGEHSRYSHSIGVMHLAGVFAESLCSRYFLDGHSNPSKGNQKALFNKYFFLARLWGLIHDIGHGPLSHAFEYYALNNHSLNHEILGRRLVEERIGRVERREDDDFGKALYHYIQTFDINKELILDVFRKKAKKATEGVEYALHQYLFKGYYNVDVTDYIQRDSYFCGVPEYGKIDWDRIVKTAHLMKDPEDEKLKVVIEERATHTITSLLISRIHMYSAVYFHKDARSFEQLFKTLMESADMFGYFEKYLPNYPNWDKNFEDLDDCALMKHFSMLQERDNWNNIKQTAFREAKKAVESIVSGILPTEAIFEARVHERESHLKIPAAILSYEYKGKCENAIKNRVKKLVDRLSKEAKIGPELKSSILKSLNKWYIDSSSFDMSRLRPIRSGQYPFPSDIPVVHRRTGEIVPISKFEPLLRDMPFSYYILRLHIPSDVDEEIKQVPGLFKELEKIFDEGIYSKER